MNVTMTRNGSEQKRYSGFFSPVCTKAEKDGIKSSSLTLMFDDRGICMSDWTVAFRTRLGRLSLIKKMAIDSAAVPIAAKLYTHFLAKDQ